MCSIVYVGVSGYRGDAMQLFMQAGFKTASISNPTAGALPGSIRFEVTVGGCSCALYSGGEVTTAKDPDQLRRKYEKKGWSAAKIDRALASATRSHTTPQLDPRDHRSQFVSAVKALVEGGGYVTLLAHFFDGSFSAPFAILGSTRIELGEYAKTRNSFPEDSLVSIQPSA